MGHGGVWAPGMGRKPQGASARLTQWQTAEEKRFIGWRSRAWQWEKAAQTSLRAKGRREKKRR